MKKRFGREMIWMLLPVMVLGGVGWWTTRRNERVKLAPAPVAVKGMAPRVTVRRTVVSVDGPLSRASGQAQEECRIEVHLRFVKQTSAPMAAVSLSPSVLDITDAKGLSFFKGASAITNLSYQTGGIFDQNALQQQLDIIPAIARFYVQTNLIPPKVGPVFLIGDAMRRPTPPLVVKIPIRPLWRTRSAKSISLKRCVWTPTAPGEGNVTVDLNYRGKAPLNLESPRITTKYEWSLDRNNRVFRSADQKKQNRILSMWSPRVESIDGKYNSLDALKAHLQAGQAAAEQSAKARGEVGFSYSPSDIADTFRPRVEYPERQLQGSNIRLIYKIDGLPSRTSSALRFKNEIFLVDDGVLSISCLLKSKPTR